MDSETCRANRFVVISGCSGGGKSTLLSELAGRGMTVMPEPGRRIVQEELAGQGDALPWVDLGAFARRAVEMALRDRATACGAASWVFFDRGLVDAAAALEHATGEPALARWGGTHRYHRRVFMAPPWPAIYATDPERPHGLAESIAEYGRLERAYAGLRYELIELPRVSVRKRADFVLERLDGIPPRKREG